MSSSNRVPPSRHGRKLRTFARRGNPRVATTPKRKDLSYYSDDRGTGFLTEQQSRVDVLHDLGGATHTGNPSSSVGNKKKQSSTVAASAAGPLQEARNQQQRIMRQRSFDLHRPVEPRLKGAAGAQQQQSRQQQYSRYHDVESAAPSERAEGFANAVLGRQSTQEVIAGSSLPSASMDSPGDLIPRKKRRKMLSDEEKQHEEDEAGSRSHSPRTPSSASGGGQVIDLISSDTEDLVENLLGSPRRAKKRNSTQESAASTGKETRQGASSSSTSGSSVSSGSARSMLTQQPEPSDQNGSESRHRKSVSRMDSYADSSHSRFSPSPSGSCALSPPASSDTIVPKRRRQSEPNHQFSDPDQEEVEDWPRNRKTGLEAKRAAEQCESEVFRPEPPGKKLLPDECVTLLDDSQTARVDADENVQPAVGLTLSKVNNNKRAAKEDEAAASPAAKSVGTTRSTTTSAATSRSGASSVASSVGSLLSKTAGAVAGSVAGFFISKKKKPNKSSKTAVVPGGSLNVKKRESPEKPSTQPTPKKRRMRGVEPCRFQPSRITRRSRKSPEVVEIADDSDEDDNDDTSKDGAVEEVFDVVRIAVGKQVSHSECQVVFKADAAGSKASLDLRFVTEGRVTRNSSHGDTKCISMDQCELAEVYYHKSCETEEEEEDAKGLNFFALLPTPQFRNVLKFEYSPLKTKNSLIVVEFRETNHMDTLLDFLRGFPMSECLHELDDDASLKDYCKALLEDSKIEVSRRQTLPPKAQANRFLQGKSEDQILLIYPFDGDPREMERCADTLKELKKGSGSGSASPIKAEEKVPARGHYLSLQVDDYMRLEPEQYLNDTLIDLWMKWISRGGSSKFHFFSTHFMSTLADLGPEGVKSWTEKKGIDVFEKKFIFFPVNKSLHWSLAVAVNVGHVSQERPEQDAPRCCILFFDSLKAHSKYIIAEKIYGWLNSEWERLKKGGPAPFSKKTMPVYAPQVPYQNNGWDCGVFVCRYAYAMYQMRDEHFLCGSKITKMITNHPEFGFRMADIHRIRKEFQTLIENLSDVYTPWKAQTDRKAKEEKRRARAARNRDAATPEKGEYQETYVAEEKDPQEAEKTHDGRAGRAERNVAEARAAKGNHFGHSHREGTDAVEKGEAVCFGDTAVKTVDSDVQKLDSVFETADAQMNKQSDCSTAGSRTATQEDVAVLEVILEPQRHPGCDLLKESREKENAHNHTVLGQLAPTSAAVQRPAEHGQDMSHSGDNIENVPSSEERSSEKQASTLCSKVHEDRSRRSDRGMADDEGGASDNETCAQGEGAPSQESEVEIICVTKPSTSVTVHPEEASPGPANAPRSAPRPAPKVNAGTEDSTTPGSQTLRNGRATGTARGERRKKPPRNAKEVYGRLEAEAAAKRAQELMSKDESSFEC